MLMRLKDRLRAGLALILSPLVPLFGAIKEALPLPLDALNGTMKNIEQAHLGLDPPPLPTAEEVRKLQTGGLVGIIALAAADRAVVGKSLDDLLLMSALVLFYVGAVAFVVWVFSRFAALVRIPLLSEHSTDRILTNVIGSFAIGLMAFLATAIFLKIFVTDSLYQLIGQDFSDNPQRLPIVAAYVGGLFCLLFCLFRRSRPSYAWKDRLVYALLIVGSFVIAIYILTIQTNFQI